MTDQRAPIEALKLLYSDLRKEYTALFKYDPMGKNLSEEIQKKADELHAHFTAVWTIIEARELELGIETVKNIPLPNATQLSPYQSYWRQVPFEVILTAVGEKMGWPYDKVCTFFLNMGTDWLIENDQCMLLGENEDFWLFFGYRIQTVLSNLMSSEQEGKAFRITVAKKTKEYLFSEDTFKAYSRKFLVG